MQTNVPLNRASQVLSPIQGLEAHGPLKGINNTVILRGHLDLRGHFLLKILSPHSL